MGNAYILTKSHLRTHPSNKTHTLVRELAGGERAKLRKITSPAFAPHHLELSNQDAIDEVKNDWEPTILTRDSRTRRPNGVT